MENVHSQAQTVGKSSSMICSQNNLAFILYGSKSKKYLFGILVIIITDNVYEKDIDGLTELYMNPLVICII